MTKVNFNCDVVMLIDVKTGGHESSVKAVDIHEAYQSGDYDLIKSCGEAVNESEEVKNALSVLYAAATKHKEKYPDTSIKITPCFSLKELKEI